MKMIFSGQDIETEVADMVDGLTKRFQSIWRPNTKFTIQIATFDKVEYAGEGGNIDPDTRYHNFAFETTATLGHFHKNHDSYTSLATQGREDEYKLKDLKHYIDYAASFPDPSGKLVNAKPLYYGAPVLYLFFRDAYMYAMFTNWDA